jgi:hypothetical protein
LLGRLRLLRRPAPPAALLRLLLLRISVAATLLLSVSVAVPAVLGQRRRRQAHGSQRHAELDRRP